VNLGEQAVRLVAVVLGGVETVQHVAPGNERPAAGEVDQARVHHRRPLKVARACQPRFSSTPATSLSTAARGSSVRRSSARSLKRLRPCRESSPAGPSRATVLWEYIHGARSTCWPRSWTLDWLIQIASARI